MSLQGQRVAVVGLGLSGRAAASLALRLGAEVVAVDTREHLETPEGVRRGTDWTEELCAAELVVVSPGVAAAHPAIQAAIAAGVDVVGELGFADRFVDVPTIGITGTNGKSTVTSFVGTLLQAAGRKTFVGGNLGTPLSTAVGESWDAAVIEVSSYQLELPGNFAPEVAIVLNLTPDHLARHGTMEGYAEAKVRIFARQGPEDIAILPVWDERLRTAAEGQGSGQRVALGALPGVRREGRRAEVQLRGTTVVFDLSEVDVPGAHNLDHAATAAALTYALGLSVDEIHEGLGRLEALPHRMQPVPSDDGVLWIDDSKATNIASTHVAVAGLDRAAVVLLGGEAKGPGFAELADALQRHRAVLCFGGSGEAIAAELTQAGVAVEHVPWMDDAVARARALAQPGDAVLLSPGCASFDAYDNFAHRGRVFAQLVGAP